MRDANRRRGLFYHATLHLLIIQYIGEAPKQQQYNTDDIAQNFWH
jgi:hypothetical protein